MQVKSAQPVKPGFALTRTVAFAAVAGKGPLQDTPLTCQFTPVAAQFAGAGVGVLQVPVEGAVICVLLQVAVTLPVFPFVEDTVALPPCARLGTVPEQEAVPAAFLHEIGYPVHG